MFVASARHHLQICSANFWRFGQA